MAKQTLSFLLLVAAVLVSLSEAFMAPSVYSSRAATRAQATRLQAVLDASSPDEFDKVR